MTPRAQIDALNEAMDIATPVEDTLQQLTTCRHNKLPVYEGKINRGIGILHVLKVIALLNQEDELTAEHFRQLRTPPYFIPEDTSVFT